MVHGPGGAEDEHILIALMGGVFYFPGASASCMATHIQQPSPDGLVGNGHDDDSQQDFQDEATHSWLEHIHILHTALLWFLVSTSNSPIVPMHLLDEVPQ